MHILTNGLPLLKVGVLAGVEVQFMTHVKG